MSIVTITLNNKSFNLSCADESKQDLLKVADKLNTAILKTKDANPSASFELLLVMTALHLQDEKYESMAVNEIKEPPLENFQEILSALEMELKKVAKKFKK